MAAVFGTHLTGGAAVFGLEFTSGFSVSVVGLPSAAAVGSPAFSLSAGFAVVAAGIGGGAVIGAPAFAIEGEFTVVPGGLPSGAAIGSPRFTFTDGTYLPEATNPRRLVVVPDPRLQGTTLPGSGGPFPQPLPLSPGSHLDLEWDWRPWLGDDLAVGFDINWQGPALGALVDPADRDGIARIWLTLPEDATQGVRGQLICTLTTAAGRVDNRKYELLVKQL